MPNSGAYGITDLNSQLPLADNFDIQVWVKSSGTSQGDNFFVTSPGGLSLAVVGNSYAAHDGSTFFSTGPAITTAWTKLEILRSSGVSSFYVNGVQQAGTSLSGNFNAGLHLGVAPGGASGFSGNIDELLITTVPEPASLVLCGLRAVGLFVVARRRTLR